MRGNGPEREPSKREDANRSRLTDRYTLAFDHRPQPTTTTTKSFANLHPGATLNSFQVRNLDEEQFYLSSRSKHEPVARPELPLCVLIAPFDPPGRLLHPQRQTATTNDDDNSGIAIRSISGPETEAQVARRRQRSSEGDGYESKQRVCPLTNDQRSLHPTRRRRRRTVARR